MGTLLPSVQHHRYNKHHAVLQNAYYVLRTLQVCAAAGVPNNGTSLLTERPCNLTACTLPKCEVCFAQASIAILSRLRSFCRLFVAHARRQAPLDFVFFPFSNRHAAGALCVKVSRSSLRHVRACARQTHREVHLTFEL